MVVHSAIPIFERLKQDNHKFEASLSNLIKFKNTKGWRGRPVIEHLLGMCGTLGSNPSTTETKHYIRSSSGCSEWNPDGKLQSSLLGSGLKEIRGHVLRGQRQRS